MTFHAPTETNPPFTAPPTWPFNSTSERWEANYRLILLEAAVIWLFANPALANPPTVITGTNPATVPLTIQGAPGQTSNVFAVQASGGANLFSVDPSGNTTTAGNSSVGGNMTVAGTLAAGNTTITGTLSVSGNVSMGLVRNTRIQKRVTVVAQAALPAINTDIADVVTINFLAQPITSMSQNLTGVPLDGDRLDIRIIDNGTAQTISWGGKFTATGSNTLPVTTVPNVRLYTQFVWDVASNIWVLTDSSAGYPIATTPAPTTGQLLQWNGTAWAPYTPLSVAGHLASLYTVTTSLVTFLSTAPLAVGTWLVNCTATLLMGNPAGAVMITTAFGTGGGTLEGCLSAQSGVSALMITTMNVCFIATVTTPGTINFQAAMSGATTPGILAVTGTFSYANATGYTATKIA